MSLGDRALHGRAAALLILLGVVIAAWLGPVAAYRDLLAADAEQIDTKGQVLQRYRALTEAAATGAVPQTVAASRGVPVLLFPEIPDSQAVALLQEAVKSAAAAAQVQVQGLQVLKAEPLPGAVRIGLRIRGSADTTGLARLLYAIETARPALYPDNLQIQAPPMPAAAAPVLLEFQVDVAGFKSGPST